MTFERRKIWLMSVDMRLTSKYDVAKITSATMATSTFGLLKDFRSEIVIVDEAAQMTEVASISIKNHRLFHGPLLSASIVSLTASTVPVRIITVLNFELNI